MHIIPLTDVPRALYNAGFQSPRYRKIYELALDGAFPAQRGANGRWNIKRDDLESIAKAMDLQKLDGMAA